MVRNARSGLPRARRARSRAPSARREELRDVRQAVLAATERLLSDRRLDEITVLDIIEAARVSRATFYIYFESKQVVVGALAEAIMEQLYNDLWAPFIAGTEPPSDELMTDHMLESMAVWREHRPVLVAAAEAWRADAAAFYHWGALWRRYVSDVRDYIERARASGQAPDGADAQTLAALLVWGNESALYLAFSGAAPELEADERLAKAISAMWMRTIYAATPFT
jgi:AcrR family transcriptional regulator